MTSKPKAQTPIKQGRRRKPTPMGLEDAISIAFNCIKNSENPLHSRFWSGAGRAYKSAQKIIKNERLNNEQQFNQTAKKLLDEEKISQSFYDNLLDEIPPTPLEVKDQQPKEREIMGENFKSGKGRLKLEFRDITDPIEVGKTILDARKAAGLSQNQLVEKSNNNVSLRTISKLESGKAKHVPQMTTLVEIAKATGMKLKITLER